MNDDRSQEIGTRAPYSQARPAARAADLKPEADKKEVSAIPEGYEPDTSSTYVKGEAEDGSQDKIVHEDGTETGIGQVAPKNVAMQNLPANHTYRDRVEAQAKDLGIEIDPAWTFEFLMWNIRMKASS